MKLNQIRKPLHDGGGAVPGCGVIHRNEVLPTLKKLAQDLHLPDLTNRVLGSTGKKEYSGDIDIVLDDKSPEEIMELFKDLQTIYGSANVAKNGSMVHLRHPIENFDPSKDEHLPRNGYVQIDFNFGDVDWEKTYHHSPGESSAYKGAHRNLAISAIAANTDVVASDERDSHDRPITEIRWKWGQKGFSKVERKSLKDKRTGNWMRKQEDVILDGPYKDATIISKILFPQDGSPDDLDSLESIIEAVKRNFEPAVQQHIFARMAKNFKGWKDYSNYTYPAEIAQYFPPNDK